MNDEIKEILDNPRILMLSYGNFILLDDYVKLKDYITNLQEQLRQASLDIQELTERDIECPSWCDKLTNLQQENNNLKTSLDESQEVVIDLQQKNERLKLELSGYREAILRDDKLLGLQKRIEKAVEYIMSELVDEWSIKNDGCVDGSDLPVSAITPILDILNGRSDE